MGTVSIDEAGAVTGTGARGASGQVALQRLPATSVLRVRVDVAGYRSATQTVPVGQTSLCCAQ